MFKDKKNQGLEDQVSSLKEQIKKYKVTITNFRDEKAITERAHNSALKKKNERVSRLVEDIEILQNINNDRIAITTRAIALDERETILDAKESQYKTFEKELKAVNEEATEKAETMYQTGYSDGLADGLRKIHEITAEDRKQAMQVAALAASSHTPGAAKKIAEGIQESMLLTAGQDTREDEMLDD